MRWNMCIFSGSPTRRYWQSSSLVADWCAIAYCGWAKISRSPTWKRPQLTSTRISAGWEMESLREEIAKRIQQERSEYDRLMASVEQLYAQGALATESAVTLGLRGRRIEPGAYGAGQRTPASAAGDSGRKAAGGRSALGLPRYAPGGGPEWLWVWKTPCRI